MANGSVPGLKIKITGVILDELSKSSSNLKGGGDVYATPILS